VEKPLTLDWAGLALVREAQEASGVPLFVGFNRRYAPLAVELRELPGPRLMAYRVNAGRVPKDHWANDLARGGGRLKGEGCHFIDFLCDQCGSDPVSVTARGFASSPELPLAATDNFSAQIAFEDGSQGSVHYAADAPPGPGKERFETTSPGHFAVLDDFRTGAVWSDRRRRRLGARKQDKGFGAQFAFVRDVIAGEIDAPSPDSFFLSALATLAAARSLESGQAEAIVQVQEFSAEPSTEAEVGRPK
jgi:predicted dehydrogenase